MIAERLSCPREKSIEAAVVDAATVRDYLLSPAHPIGRFKARVFAAVGYRQETWERLRDDLRELATTVEVQAAGSDRFGERFVGIGDLATPTGALLPVVTAWLIPSEVDPPRLITVYPRAP